MDGNKIEVWFFGHKRRLDSFEPRPYRGARLVKHIFQSEGKTVGNFCDVKEDAKAET
jgi:hypothetical protein